VLVWFIEIRFGLSLSMLEQESAYQHMIKCARSTYHEERAYEEHHKWIGKLIIL